MNVPVSASFLSHLEEERRWHSKLWRKGTEGQCKEVLEQLSNCTVVYNSSLFSMVHALVQWHFSWAQATLFSFSCRDLGHPVCPHNCTILCIKLSLRFPLLWLAIPLLARPLAWKVCWVGHIYTHYTPICSQALVKPSRFWSFPQTNVSAALLLLWSSVWVRTSA